MEKRQTCDLAGIWRFEIDKEDRGFAEHWEKRRLTQTITLPGCLQAQGYGKSRPKTITKKLARLYPQFKEGDILTPEFIDELSDEDAEAADQINRRTEFQVLSTDYQAW